MKNEGANNIICKYKICKKKGEIKGAVKYQTENFKGPIFY